MTGLDWPGLMQAGLHQLRLDPARFWALTPMELSLMLGQVKPVKPLSRSRLEALIRAYPDQTPKVTDV